MKNKKFLAIFSILITLGVINIASRIIYFTNRLDVGQKRQSKHYPSINYEVEVSERLKQLNVPHKIDKRGVLWYRSRNKNFVEKTYKEVTRGHFPEWPNVTYANKEHQEYFISLLKKEDVPYITRKLDAEGNVYILWNPTYDEVVQKLQEKVLAEIKNQY